MLWDGQGREGYECWGKAGAGLKRRVIGESMMRSRKMGPLLEFYQKASGVRGDLCPWRECEPEATYEFLLFPLLQQQQEGIPCLLYSHNMQTVAKNDWFGNSHANIHIQVSLINSRRWPP